MCEVEFCIDCVLVGSKVGTFRRIYVACALPQKFVSEYVVDLSWLLRGGVVSSELGGRFVKVCVCDGQVLASSP